MRKIINLTPILLFTVVLIMSCQSNQISSSRDAAPGPRTSVLEENVRKVSNDMHINGFISCAANYEIINIPGDNRTDVIKLSRDDESDWNVFSYSLNDYRGKLIYIRLSADVMRIGAQIENGALHWRLHGTVLLENNQTGTWNRMNGTITRTLPSDTETIIYLQISPEKIDENSIYYFDNLEIKIESWDYAPSAALQTAGENNTDGTRNYYVSADRGSDNGDGTQARPFKKINHAFYYVKPGDTVLVDSGVYYERIRIPSGSEGKPVTITAMPGAEVIITPTVQITAQWRQHSGNIHVADISRYINEIDTEYPQLFADGDSMVEARFPNMGPSMSAIMDYKRDVAQKGTNKNIITASRNIPADITGARVVVWPGAEWVAGWFSSTCFVHSVNGRNIILSRDMTRIDPYTPENDVYTPYPGNAFYITGALALLDAPGEYYFDSNSGLLYFYPPWNGSPGERDLSLRSFCDIALQAENASNVIIKNITFFGGGVSMKDSRNSTLENCRVKYAEHFYIYSIIRDQLSMPMLVSGSNNKIIDCEFGPSAASGIALAGENHIFSNNIVHDTGYNGLGTSGARVWDGAKNIEISHNTIIDSGRQHIALWATGVFENIIIRNNYMENNSILNYDSGAFSTFMADGGGTEIFNNFVIVGDKGDNGAMAKPRNGLYPDNYCSNIDIHHNIVIGGSTGIQVNLWAKNINVYNNTVVGSNLGIGFYAYPSDNADASTVSVTDNLFVNIKTNDIGYSGTEDGVRIEQDRNFLDGTIPFPVRAQGRMQSSGNARGTVDSQYRPTGSTPDAGAIPRNGRLFAYGADWSL
ncbi:MAG: right-handed parallel beta-helix repeat-containing protein [Treponema sp.]|nr:right-handed parallel beta-helix repeat-containing protein [Treponema sp.]